ncbi:MAG: mechanosensitive ion channel [Novosphingobium sp.]|nr:mechanosensitive ion channel [Novosphingobium sp.]MCP5401184.1 mechanosensitive ion channel [Novosphingobium sp.]
MITDSAPAPSESAAEAATVTSPAPEATPEAASSVADETLKAAVGIKEAVASKSHTVGSIVETLDSYRIGVGDSYVSLWGALVVVMVLVAVLVLARVGSRLAKMLFNKLTRLDATQRLLGEKLVSIAVWVIAILIGIDVLGIDLTALAFFSGAFGLAMGFGLQKTFGNLISGIILLMDRSIKPGDVIAVTDAAGNESFGQIRKIGIRAVSIITRDRKEYLIPNENLMINQVENWSYSSRHVRIQVPVGVSYKADIKQAEELMLKAADQCDRVLKDPAPTVWLDAYGDSSVNFVIHCWITDPEQGVGNVRSEVLKALWWLFKENDVEIPFPQRDINLRENEAFQELIDAMRDRPAKPENDA